MVNSAHRFPFYTTKLQPGFSPSCVLQCFSYFEPTFSMMSCLTLEPRLCPAQPSWWTRHIDFHTSCLFSSLVKTYFRNVLANLFIFNQNCRTVLSSWGVPCQKCRTVVFFAAPSRQLGRGFKILFLWPGSKAFRFSYILISKLAISGSWSSLGLFGLLKAPES